VFYALFCLHDAIGDRGVIGSPGVEAIAVSLSFGGVDSRGDCYELADRGDVAEAGEGDCVA
jgi:hypothetical protein